MAGTPQGGTIARNVGAGDETLKTVTWTLTTANTDGMPVEVGEGNELEWAVGQGAAVAGENWGGATCQIEGANFCPATAAGVVDGTLGNFIMLTRTDGNGNMSFTSDGLKKSNECPRFARPRLSTAGNSAQVTIVATIRKVVKTIMT